MPRAPRRLPSNNGHSNGNGVPRTLYANYDPIALNRMRDLTVNITSLRKELFAQFDKRRSIEDECGHPKTVEVDPWKLKDMYETDPIAARVVEVFPKECFQVTPLVYEDEDPDNVTPFEEAWDNLGNQLRGENCWYKEDEGSPVWNYLLRADILSRVGQYGVILLGLDDGLDMSEPVEGIVEKNSESKSIGKDKVAGEGDQVQESSNGKTGDAQAQAQVPPEGKKRQAVYNLTVNAEETKGRKLLFVRVLPETLATVTSYETNITSPRYGMPTAYNVTINDPREFHTGIGLPTLSKQVHWTRIVHIADNVTSNECFGRPAMRPVLTRLLDLQKLYGSSAEGYWRACINLMTFETHPQLGGDVDFDADDIKDQWEKTSNSLDRAMVLAGMSAKAVAPNVIDPTPHILVQIEAICIKLAIPKRVFMGSERGELASSQDDSAWNDRIKQRQANHVTPRIIIPFIDRLIQVGVLPEPTFKPAPKPKPDFSNLKPVSPMEQPQLPQTVKPQAPPGGGFPPKGPPGAGGPPKPGGNPFAKKPPVGNLTANFPPDDEEGPEEADEPMEIETGDGEDEQLLDKDDQPLDGEGLDSEGAELGDPEMEAPVYQRLGYCIEWPDITSKDAAEQAAVAAQNTATLSQYIQGGCEAMIPPQHFLTSPHFLGMDEEEAGRMLEDAQEVQAQLEEQKMLQQEQMMEQTGAAIDEGLVPDPTDPEQVKAHNPQPIVGGAAAGGPPQPGQSPFPPKGKKPPFAANVENAEDDEDGRWVTTDDGARLFIKGGELLTKPDGEKVADKGDDGGSYEAESAKALAKGVGKVALGALKLAASPIIEFGKAYADNLAIKIGNSFIARAPRNILGPEARSETLGVIKGIFSRLTLGTGPLAIKAIRAGIKAAPTVFRGFALAARGLGRAAGWLHGVFEKEGPNPATNEQWDETDLIANEVTANLEPNQERLERALEKLDEVLTEIADDPNKARLFIAACSEALKVADEEGGVDEEA